MIQILKVLYIFLKGGGPGMEDVNQHPFRLKMH